MSNRKPTKILELKGAFKKDPSRRREAEPLPTEPVGDCPSHLSEQHKVIWSELVFNCVPGVLTIQDRHSLELVVMGIHDVRHGVEVDGVIKHVGGAERDRVFKQLGRFGLTPVDRASVQVPKDKPQVTGFSRGL